MWVLEIEMGPLDQNPVLLIAGSLHPFAIVFNDELEFCLFFLGKNLKFKK